MKSAVKAALVAAIAAAAIGASAFVALSGKGGGDPRAGKDERPALEFAPADIVQLAQRPLEVELTLPGTVQALAQATVRSKLSAEVRRVLPREGDAVAAGQIVAEFDTAQVKAQLAERTAALESARAQLAQTERTRQVNAQLIKQNFISQNAFDTADAAYRAQAAAVEVAQAQLAQTRLLLDDAVVRAPIGGLVARRYVQPGEKVAFDAPLLAIVDLSRLEVQAQAPVSDVAQVAAGAPAEVEVEGLPGRTFEGRVERINPSAEPGTRTINVYIALANDRSVLRAGMFARARLRVGQPREAATLPLAAIQLDNGQTFVWVITEGRLSRRMVKVGSRDERAQRAEILEGVAAGERVLATRFDNLREGLAAKVVGSVPGVPKAAEADAPPLRN